MSRVVSGLASNNFPRLVFGRCIRPFALGGSFFPKTVARWPGRLELKEFPCLNPAIWTTIVGRRVRYRPFRLPPHRRTRFATRIANQHPLLC